MDSVQTQYVACTKRLQEIQGKGTQVVVFGIIRIYIKQYPGGPTAHFLDELMLVQHFARHLLDIS